MKYIVRRACVFHLILIGIPSYWTIVYWEQRSRGWGVYLQTESVRVRNDESYLLMIYAYYKQWHACVSYVRGKVLAALACYPSCHFTYNVVEWFFWGNVVFQANQKRISLIIVSVTQIRMGESKTSALPVFIW